MRRNIWIQRKAQDVQTEWSQIKRDKIKDPLELVDKQITHLQLK